MADPMDLDTPRASAGSITPEADPYEQKRNEVAKWLLHSNDGKELLEWSDNPDFKPQSALLQKFECPPPLHAEFGYAVDKLKNSQRLSSYKRGKDDNKMEHKIQEYLFRIRIMQVYIHDEGHPDWKAVKQPFDDYLLDELCNLILASEAYFDTRSGGLGHPGIQVDANLDRACRICGKQIFKGEELADFKREECEEHAPHKACFDGKVELSQRMKQCPVCDNHVL